MRRIVSASSGTISGFPSVPLRYPRKILIVKVYFAFLCTLCLTPFNICTDVFRLACYIEFCTGLITVDSLFFKIHINAQIFQRSYIFQAVNSISCKSCNGFCDNHIYFALFTTAHHSVKLITFFYTCARDAFIGIYSLQLPIFFGIDSVRIVSHLIFVTVELFFLLGRYSAISGNSKKAII